LPTNRNKIYQLLWECNRNMGGLVREVLSTESGMAAYGRLAPSFPVF
jgi:hypothetical protein